MSKLINDKRINQIITFLKSLDIKSKRFNEKIDSKNQKLIQIYKELYQTIYLEWQIVLQLICTKK